MKHARIEIDPGVFIECPTRRQRILDVISDPSVKKMLVMRWLERREIYGDEAEELIRENGLEGCDG